ncbi:hypothetical protein TTHERM_000753349 (macronuclear) [Tetrahymena thermophila SB210]|uniref:Uncharacterized protein n=1 Tax=Tetrahymena thermophila (strain SB210) TaxID=312017 RepID=W7XBP6_TETTS|nr:hypothetical protein TTHERM_000753349 [Tetrahymena thermophila SB210]EWS73818.1 hypothetical protein TTHERM_000753349 [Tetrahymena thermophila SB210]|eukprot:XP_012653641.1 hypothetical protein TTHERM_000753349 [Tetrahymena thermophila SB210]
MQTKLLQLQRRTLFFGGTKQLVQFYEIYLFKQKVLTQVLSNQIYLLIDQKNLNQLKFFTPHYCPWQHLQCNQFMKAIQQILSTTNQIIFESDQFTCLQEYKSTSKLIQNMTFQSLSTNLISLFQYHILKLYLISRYVQQFPLQDLFALNTLFQHRYFSTYFDRNVIRFDKQFIILNCQLLRCVQTDYLSSKASNNNDSK